MTPMEQRRASAPLRVIVVDDDRDTVDTLALLLADAGCVVHKAYSGKEVLPAARLFRPDVIILDIQVPGMSGYAVAQQIRHSFLDARRPMMIAMTGKWPETPDRLIAEQVGFDHHLLKPCDPAQVLGLLAPRLAS